MAFTQDQTLISAPSVLVNGVSIPIIANTIELIPTNSKKVVDSSSNGGQNTTLNIGIDMSENYSTIKFKIRPTVTNKNLVKQWFNDLTGLTIQWTDSFSGEAGGVSNGAMTNAPSIPFMATGEIEVEIKAEPYQG